ncbi:S1 family peptidase [Pedomonas sp. V897]|uniref:S1 family peptidase n=1 Tax=Pedomonas sp. V897 TaxID=3446482 RepID=UPI003EE38A5F
MPPIRTAAIALPPLTVTFQSLFLFALAALCALASGPAAANLVEAVRKVQPSVVGITTFQVTRPLASHLAGTGFVVGDGRHVVTNAHVIRSDPSKGQQALFALVRNGSDVDRRQLSIVAQDPAHDLALLRMSGDPLPAVRLRSDPELLPEGSAIAVTGFPIGTVLGLYPATQAGIVSARPPNISPQPDSRFLDAAFVAAPRYEVYQLDLVAYPGHSGSPLYDAGNGEVVGILNATFIKTTREKVISEPSGIAYAIPAGFIRQLLLANGLKP